MGYKRDSRKGTDRTDINTFEDEKTQIRKGDLSRNFLGSVETAIFMKSGAGRFTQNNSSMKKSFIVPILALLPATLVMVFSAYPEGALSDGARAILALVYGARLVVYLAVFPALVYLLAKAVDRLDGFSRFVTAHNWLALPLGLLILPLAYMMADGSHSWAEIQPMLSMAMIYFSVYVAFMATYVMRMPWELAGFVAITGIAVHQTSLDILKWVAAEAVILVS